MNAIFSLKTTELLFFFSEWTSYWKLSSNNTSSQVTQETCTGKITLVFSKALRAFYNTFQKSHVQHALINPSPATACAWRGLSTFRQFYCCQWNVAQHGVLRAWGLRARSCPAPQRLPWSAVHLLTEGRPNQIPRLAWLRLRTGDATERNIVLNYKVFHSHALLFVKTFSGVGVPCHSVWSLTLPAPSNMRACTHTHLEIWGQELGCLPCSQSTKSWRV